MHSPTLYQIAYAAAFTQAFNHYMQGRGLVPTGCRVQGYPHCLQGVVADPVQLRNARHYARLQAKVAADQWVLSGEEGDPV